MTVATDNVAAKGIDFVAPDGGWGWVIVLSSLMIHLIMDGITYASGQYLPVLAEELNVSYGVTSVIHGLLPAITLGCGPIGSSLTNRFGCRFTTIIGAIIASVGFLLSVLWRNIFFLYFTIGIVVGIGFGLIYVPAIVSVGYYFEKRRAIAMGIAVCGSGLGTFLFAPLNRILLNTYYWEGAFIVKAAIILNVCLCGALMIPLPIEPSEITKRKKKLQKKLRNEEEQIEKSENDEKKEFLMKEKKSSNAEIAKIADSLPNLLSSDRKKPENNSQDKNDTKLFFKSLPHLANNNPKVINKFEDALLRSYSSFNVLARIRSLKNINDPKHETVDVNKNLNEAQQIIVTNINAAKKADGNTEEIEAKTFDLKILLNFIFVFFSISNFLTSLGFNAPFIFINHQAMSYGISETDADWILQTIGISNTVGRIVLGALSDIKNVNRVYLYSTVITICGVATVIEPFLQTFPLMMLYAVVFGFTSGGYVSMTSILLADLFGLENLSNAFGILLLFQGVATAIGPPVAGAMRDVYKSYKLPFIFLGSMITISGVMCYLIPCLPNYVKPKRNEDTENPDA